MNEVTGRSIAGMILLVENRRTCRIPYSTVSFFTAYPKV